MQIELSAVENSGWIDLSVRVHLEGAEDKAWAVLHFNPHREVRWAVPAKHMHEWREHQRFGDIKAALSLCEPTVILWDQVELQAESADTVIYRRQVADGLISRALIERLRRASSADAVERDLRMLELENTLSRTAERGDRDAELESLLGSDHELAEACPPAPVLLECGQPDRSV